MYETDKVKFAILSQLRESSKRYNDLHRAVNEELNEHVPDAKFDRRITKLLKENEENESKGIVNVTKDRASWYCRPENEEKLREKLGVKQKTATAVSSVKDAQWEMKKKHSDEMKEKVIRPWIEQLPDMYIDGPKKITLPHKFPYKYETREKYFMYDDPDQYRERGYTELEVESACFFEDFRNHLSFSPDPFDLLDELKENSKKFIELWHPFNTIAREVIEKWSKEILKESATLAFGSARELVYTSVVSTVLEKNGYALGLSTELKPMYSNSPIEIEGYSIDFPENPDFLLDDDHKKLYEIVVSDETEWNSAASGCSCNGISWVKVPAHMQGEQTPSINLKNSMFRILLCLVNPPDKLFNAGEKLAKQLIEIYDLRKQLIEVLEKHLERKILEKECNYIRME